MMKILERIKRIRIDKGFSQEYMAKELSISQNNYSKIERGVSKLTVDRLVQIADILNVSHNLLIDQTAECSDKIKPLGHSHIEICPTCNGEGRTPNIPEIGDSDTYFTETCRHCKGSGRVKITITKIVEPFKLKNHE